MFPKAAFVTFASFIVLPYVLAYTLDGASLKTFYLGSVDGKSYFADSEPLMTWVEAQQHCNDSGMHLASVTTKAQNNLLLSSYHNVSFFGKFWTGGRDSLTMEQFIWDHTKEAANGSVANPSYYPYTPQTCVSFNISSVNGYFFGNRCVEKFKVLCEVIHS